MNNQQFRRLLLSDTQKPHGDQSKPAAVGTPTAVLGARKHSSIPMTPRQLGRGSVQTDFARQLAERNAKANPHKQARSSAPKGTKLAEGYIDRTKTRVDPDDSELAKRIQNLEESMKLGQIDRATFENLVQEITGGQVATTHLVKGLDRKLLERVRRGEDVLVDHATEEKQEDDDLSPAVEHAFDELADVQVDTITRAKAEKKGRKRMSPPLPISGTKRSRDDILKELRRQREAAAMAAAAEHEKKFPTLGPGFRKINAQGETSRMETDEKGRQVLIIKAVDGTEKRKVRKQKPEDQSTLEIRHDLDDASKPINMHNLPESKQEESEDGDIFEGVGSNYNPLAGLDDEDEESAEEEVEVDHGHAEGTLEQDRAESKASSSETNAAVPKSLTTTGPTKRDYFKASRRETENTIPSDLSSADATVRAALAKARNLDENSFLLQHLSADQPDSNEARLKKRAAELAAADRDLEDMDLGFGASRFDDAEDMEREGENVKFSQWKGIGANDDGDNGEDLARDPKRQRKRGPKKKRGDKNKAEDVLRVMERQKEKKTLG